MNLNRVHPLLLKWARRYIHLREVTTADVITATASCPGAGAGRPSPPCVHCSATPRRPAGFSRPDPRHPRRPAAAAPHPAAAARRDRPGHRRRCDAGRPPRGRPGDKKDVTERSKRHNKKYTINKKKKTNKKKKKKKKKRPIAAERSAEACGEIIHQING